ncbi:MAG TPA: anti-sigma factor [Trebonia sp.]|jgi:anti-sigma-K factor RskA|nr:anti-sigma factor [Trebonia sp.]
MRAQTSELHLLTGSYALDAMPAEEQARFETHLTRCHACEEEVRGMREAAARLGMATAITPPPALRTRVLAAVPRTRQLPPSGRALPSAARRAAGLPLRRTGLAAGFLALAAAIVFLVVGQVTTSGQLRQARAANQAVAAVLAAPDARVASMPATIGGTLTAVMSAREHEAVITSAGIPALARARAYQLWVIPPAGSPRSAGLLTFTGGRSVPALAAGVAPGDKIGVTVEPAGGSRQPTTAPVILMPVTA